MDRLITLEQAAVELGVSYNTVRNYIEEGLLKTVKVGSRTIRIKPEDLRIFLDKAQKKEGK